MHPAGVARAVRWPDGPEVPKFPGSAGRAAHNADNGDARRGHAHGGGCDRGRGRRGRARPVRHGRHRHSIKFAAVTADPSGQLAYDNKQASVERGKITLRLINRSRISHNVTIAKGAKVLVQTKTIQGATTSAPANLPSGDYVFFCSDDAHRQAGMQGTVTV